MKSSLTSSPTLHPFHPHLLAPLLFFLHTRCIPTSGPLHVLFPLSETFFPHVQLSQLTSSGERSGMQVSAWIALSPPLDHL